MIFLICVTAFVTLACVVLPLVTMAVFCATGRGDEEVLPSGQDKRDRRPPPGDNRDGRPQTVIT